VISEQRSERPNLDAALAHLIIDRGVSAGDDWITVAPESVRDALGALRADGYRLLTFLTCVDHLADSSREWPKRYEIVYQLRDLETLKQLRVRAFVDGDPPRIDSVHDLFPPANWDERETYDLFGIVFNDHPDLTRILMPDDWVGHPLRRDYPVGGETVEFSEEHEQWQTAPEDA
jgi:NADH-quinone oxidoreductase subunit C